MKKIALLLISFVAFGLNAQTTPATTTPVASTPATTPAKTLLYEGSLVKCAIKNTIKGGSVNVGDRIDFELAEPLIQGDKVVCQAGAKIIGAVTEARSSGVLGRKGKLAFSIDYLYLPSGQIIKLQSQNSKRLNGSGVTVAALAVINPLGLLIPGKGAKFEAGTKFDAFVAENTEIQ